MSREHSAIRSVDVATGEVRTLLDGPAVEKFDFHWAISWAAKNMVVFSSAPTDQYLTHELFALTLPTCEVRRVTFETEQGRNLLAPCVTPSGRQLVALRQSTFHSPEDFLYVLDSDFRQTDQIPVPGGPLLGATNWSADGRHLLFSAGPEGGADIYRLDLQSRTTSPLISSQGDDIEPDVFGSFDDNGP